MKDTLERKSMTCPPEESRLVGRKASWKAELEDFQMTHNLDILIFKKDRARGTGILYTMMRLV